MCCLNQNGVGFKSSTYKAVGKTMDIVCVRIGDKYGPEYEEYLERKFLSITSYDTRTL